MKKHIIIISVVVLILSLAGVGIWLGVRNKNIKPLYPANCEFVFSEDGEMLTDKITAAQTLYASVSSSDTRLTTLQTIIFKIDSFEQDLNAYLTLSNDKPKNTKSLSKSYSNLSNSRTTLIKDYNEYITRMSGNTQADGPMMQKLYNELFNKTANYLRAYNNCFLNTSNYVFEKVYTANSIKAPLYSLYSNGVNNLLSNIKNSQFSDLTLINRLNNSIKLENQNICLKNSVAGGEFSLEALNFKKYFSSSNISTLIQNFEVYYSAASSINPTTETSSEKLAVYYAKQILEI